MIDSLVSRDIVMTHSSSSNRHHNLLWSERLCSIWCSSLSHYVARIGISFISGTGPCFRPPVNHCTTNCQNRGAYNGSRLPNGSPQCMKSRTSPPCSLVHCSDPLPHDTSGSIKSVVRVDSFDTVRDSDTFSDRTCPLPDSPSEKHLAIDTDKVLALRSWCFDSRQRRRSRLRCQWKYAVDTCGKATSA